MTVSSKTVREHRICWATSLVPRGDRPKGCANKSRIARKMSQHSKSAPTDKNCSSSAAGTLPRHAWDPSDLQEPCLLSNLRNDPPAYLQSAGAKIDNETTSADHLKERACAKRGMNLKRSLMVTLVIQSILSISESSCSGGMIACTLAFEGGRTCCGPLKRLSDSA